MEQYRDFAFVYDELMNEVDYNGWVKYIEDIIKNENAQVKNILELACGTGNLTIPLTKKNYDIAGIDISDEMLSVAREKAEKEGIELVLLQQDIAELDFDVPNLDCILCACDGFNYLTYDDELESVFEKAHELLKDDGIFIMNQLSLSKREVFENISFPEGRVCEDAAVAHQFYMKIKKLTVLPYDLYRYRIVSQSIMHKKIVIKRLDIIEALYDRFLSYQNSGYIELLADTCNIAKNKMWILGRIKFVTKADKARKQQIIKMYRYMYRNVEKPVSIQCTLCYFFPYLYNKMRERLKFKRNFMHVL